LDTIAATVYFYFRGKTSSFTDNFILIGLYHDSQMSLGKPNLAYRQGDIALYPNPFNSSVNISINDLDALGDLLIYNSKGQLVKKYTGVRDKRSFIWMPVNTRPVCISTGFRRGQSMK